MPAAAVIPAPITYIKVVAVKKLTDGFLPRTVGPPLCAFEWPWASFPKTVSALHCVERYSETLL